MTKTINYMFALLIAMVSVFSSVLPAYAQENKEGIGISPTNIILEASAGQKLSGELTVINPGDAPVSYRLYTSSFRIRNESYDKDFDSEDPISTAPMSWFKFPQDTGRIASNNQEKVQYTIQVPNDAVSQGYYGVIFAETSDEQADDSGVIRRKRVGSLIYITVKGAGVRASGHLADFDVPRYMRNSPVKAHLRLANDGNVHYQTKGQIRLKNIWGKVVGESNIESTVLPQTTRKVSIELPVTRAIGIY